MATNNCTETAAGSDSDVRLPDPHAIEARGVGASAGHAPSSADERLLYPVRPTAPRPVRAPHSRPATGGGRTTPGGNGPSFVPLPLSAAPRAGGPALVRQTTIPEVSGDLLGLPDFSGLGRALRRVWPWFAAQIRAAAEMDGRLRTRRDEDSAAMYRAGVNPTRFG
ncbi:hypothetical protein [Sinomonas notoginsengisoli]|uniref:hypothetical protein n=1 Tax=Sinomonas notoginsengisoli TaxID=1457311 RepID=UPI001F17FE49|nr:hypothetical protein [Sinomonas notoginsengisoli]